MGRVILSLAGALLLAAGLYLLYAVFIDTPDEQIQTLGLRSAADNGVAEPLESDADVVAQQDAQIEAIGGDPVTENIIANNTIASAEQPVTVQSANAFADGGFQAESNGVGADTAFNDAAIAGQGGAGIGVEQRLVELEYPEAFRVGEDGTVRLTELIETFP